MGGYFFEVYQDLRVDVLPTFRVEVLPLLLGVVCGLRGRHGFVALVGKRLREGVVIVRAFFCFLDGPEHEVYLSVGTVLRSILHLLFKGCIRLAVGHGD